MADAGERQGDARGSAPRATAPVAEGGYAAVLAAVPFFAGLPPSVLEQLAAGARRVRYAPGALILAEGEPGERLFLVAEGHVRVFKALADGREYTIDLLTAGDLLALVAFLDGRANPASAVAVDDVLAYVFFRREFQATFRQEPLLAERVLDEVCQRLRRAHHRELELALRTVHERIAALLLRRIEIPGAPLELPSHEELGRMVGAARETVTRALHDLERQGAIQLERGRVRVADRRRLESWLR
jgi:CRP/FNR family cyclic AMP-dependent transcriptional regulator